MNFNNISGSNNGSFSSHLDCVGVSSAQSVLSVASSVRHDSSRSRSRLLMHADSQSSDFSSGNESTVALLQKRSLSRDELSSRQATNSSRSLSRCRNPSVNWSSTEGKPIVPHLKVLNLFSLNIKIEGGGCVISK